MEMQLPNGEFDHIPRELEKAFKQLLAEGKHDQYLLLVEQTKAAFAAAQEEIRCRLAANGVEVGRQNILLN